MGVQELFEGLKLFKEGVKDFALSKALADADEQRQEIQRGVMDEKEKNTQLKNLADSLVGRMSGLGATAAAVQQASGFGKRVEDVETAQALSASNLAKESRQQAGELQKTALKGQFDLEAERIKAAASKPTDLSGVTSKNWLQLKPEVKATVVPGIGFANSRQSANEILKLASANAKAEPHFQLLEKLDEKTFAALPSKEKAMAQQAITALVGILREPITGPGVMNETDRAQILSVIGDPTKWFARKSWELEKVKRIAKLTRSAALREAQARGVIPFADKEGVYSELDEKDPEATPTAPIPPPAAELLRRYGN